MQLQELTFQQIEQQNADAFYVMMAKVNPDLYIIARTLQDTQVNPAILPSIIRAISNIAYGTRFGEVKIHIRDGIVTHIKPEESDELQLDAVLSETAK